MWMTTIQSTESPNRTKRQRKGQFALSVELGHPSSPTLRHWHSWFSGLWTWTGTYTIGSPGSQALGSQLELIPLAFLGFQLADGRLWEFSVSIMHEPIPHNKSLSIYLYLYLYLYILLVLFLWRTLTDTHTYVNNPFIKLASNFKWDPNQHNSLHSLNSILYAKYW